MIEIILPLNGKEYTFQSPVVNDYITIHSYIRRARPGLDELTKGSPDDLKPEQRSKILETAMRVIAERPFVTTEEEENFQQSRIQWYVYAWMSLRKNHPEFGGDLVSGVPLVQDWINSLTHEDQIAVKYAVRGVDHRTLQKN